MERRFADASGGIEREVSTQGQTPDCLKLGTRSVSDDRPARQRGLEPPRRMPTLVARVLVKPGATVIDEMRSPDPIIGTAVQPAPGHAIPNGHNCRVGQSRIQREKCVLFSSVSFGSNRVGPGLVEAKRKNGRRSSSKAIIEIGSSRDAFVGRRGV